MKMRSVAPMKIAKIGYIVVSVLFCIAVDKELWWNRSNNSRGRMRQWENVKHY